MHTVKRVKVIKQKSIKVTGHGDEIVVRGKIVLSHLDLKPGDIYTVIRDGGKWIFEPEGEGGWDRLAQAGERLETPTNEQAGATASPEKPDRFPAIHAKKSSKSS